MNLSHVISEFSFGPHFPDMTQPLDYSFEVTHDRRLIFGSFEVQLSFLPSLCRVPILPSCRANNLHRYSIKAPSYTSV